MPQPLHAAFLTSTWRLLRQRQLPADHLAEVRLLPADHPAATPGRRSTGTFARARVPAFTPLCLYGGDLLDEEETERRHTLPDGQRNAYVFGIDASGAAEISIDASKLPRCFGANFNHFESILSAFNCTSVEVLCGGGCLCRSGVPFPDITHPHIVIYSTVDIEPGTELCIDYGPGYCKLMGIAPPVPTLTDHQLVNAVLGSSMATRQAILSALTDRTADVPAARSNADDNDYLDLLLSADDPASAFAEAVDLIRTFSGRPLPITTSIIAGPDITFNLNREISARSLFVKGLNRDLTAAAEFLHAFRSAAFKQQPMPTTAEPEPLRVQKRPRGRPPAALRTLAAAAADAGGDTEADADAQAGAGAGVNPGFNCYGVYVTLNQLKSAFDARIAVEPERSKGFWGRIADDVGIPNLDQCPTATGRSGAVHARYCKYFDHPFISAVGAK